MNKGIIGAIAVASMTLFIIMVALALCLIPMASAEGIYENLTTTVTVTGVAPVVGTITCTPDPDDTVTDPLTPIIGGNITLYCWATITDDNGWSNIDQATEVTNLFIDTVGGSDDLNTHYSNDSCCFGVDCSGVGSSTTILMNCSYHTRYYLDPGNWTVNFTIDDNEGLSNSTQKTDFEVYQALGLDVVETSIDFGVMTLGAEKNDTTEVRNLCNQPIDIKLAETNFTAGQLTCSGAGSDNITTAGADGIRYNKTSTAWANMVELTGTNTTYVTWDQVYYNASGTTDGIQEDTLYWTLRLPSSGVAGICSGITTFTVTEAT